MLKLQKKLVFKNFINNIKLFFKIVLLEMSPHMRLSMLEHLNQKRNIIITVDDNNLINKSVKKIIEKILKENDKDYEVIVATDGIDILKLIRKDQSNGNLIKCIITDENMEYMDGSEAIKIVRNYEKIGKIKPVNIITSTCHEDKNITQHILNCGSQIILKKPLNKVELEKVFRHLNIL